MVQQLGATFPPKADLSAEGGEVLLYRTMSLLGLKIAYLGA
jgi:hypothetical protein